MAKKRSSVRRQTGVDIHPHGSITKGPVTEDMIETRARELAFIDGRNPYRVTASDRIQAKKELFGDLSRDTAADDAGILAGGIAHDFNNLLTGVLGYAELALLNLAPEAPARANLDQIRQAACGPQTWRSRCWLMPAGAAWSCRRSTSPS